MKRYNHDTYCELKKLHERVGQAMKDQRQYNEALKRRYGPDAAGLDVMNAIDPLRDRYEAAMDTLTKYIESPFSQSIKPKP